MPTLPDGIKLTHRSDDSSAPIFSSETSERSGLPDGLVLTHRKSELERLYMDVADVEPDRAAQVIDLSRKLGQSETVVDRHLPEAQRASTAPDPALWGRLDKEYPKTASYVKDPKIMAVVKDGLDVLMVHEQLVKGHRRLVRGIVEGSASTSAGLASGGRNVQISAMGWEQMIATLRSGQQSSLYEKELAGLEGQPVEQRPGFDPVYYAAEQVPNLAMIGKQGLKRGLQGAIVGTGAGALVAGVGAAAGAQGGFAIGGRLGAFEGVAMLEGGQAFREFKQIKDATGKPIDPVLAARAGLAVGLMNSGLEYASLHMLLRTFPGGEKVLGGLLGNKEIFKNVTGKAAVKEAMRRYLQSIVSEVGTEITQQGTQIAGREAAKAASGQPFGPLDWDAVRQELASVVSPTIQAVALMGMPGTVVRLASDFTTIQQADEDKRLYLALGDVARETKLRQRLPEEYRRYVEQITKDGSVENVYIPVEALETYFQEKDIDAVTATRELGIETLFQEARETGGDVKIPLATWVEKVVGTEHYKGLADDVKFSPDALTTRQANVRAEEIGQQIAREQEGAKQEIVRSSEVETGRKMVYDYVREKLLAAKPENTKEKDWVAQVERNAQVSAAHAVAESARRGITVEEWFTGLRKPEIVRQAIDNTPINETEPVQPEKLFQTSKTGADGYQEFLQNRVSSGKLRASSTEINSLLEALASFPMGQVIEGKLGETVKFDNAVVGLDPYEYIHHFLVKRDRAGHENYSGDHIELLKEIIETVRGYDERILGEKDGKDRIYYVREFNPGGKRPQHVLVLTTDNAGNAIGWTHFESKQDYVKSLQRHEKMLIEQRGLVDKEKRQVNLSYDKYLSERMRTLLNLGSNARQGLQRSQDSPPAANNTIAQPGPNVKPGKDEIDTLSQGEKIKQGEVDIYPDKSVIKLFAEANASTFLHESAHIWLRDMFDYVRSGKASEEYLKDWKVLSDWLKITDGQKSLTTEQQEQFARGFERYLVESEAPSEGLRKAFYALSRWLARIYKDIKKLNVELSDEVRGVMDRMLATEDEIAQAEKSMGYMKDIDLSKLPADVARRVRDLQERAHEQAVSILLRQKMEEISEKHRKFLEKEHAKAVKQATKYARSQPIYKFMAEVEKRFKRPARELAQEYVDGKMPEDLKEKYDVFAEKAAYSGGDEMSHDVLKERDLEAEIQWWTDKYMEPHQDLADPELIRKEAAEIVHNEEQLELLATEREILQDMLRGEEIKSLARQRTKEETKVEISATRQKAQEILAAKPVREATAYLPYFTAERNAAADAARAMGRDDYKWAAEYKRRQMLNHALSSEALRNAREVERIHRFIRRFQKRDGDLKNMPYGFIRQVDGILGKFGLSPQSVEDVRPLALVAQGMAEKGENVYDIANATGLVQNEAGQWVQEGLDVFEKRVRDNYYTLLLPDSVKGAGKNGLAEMSLQELREVKQAVEAIGNIGRGYQRFLSDFLKGEVKEAAKALRASIEERVGKPYEDALKIGHKHGSKLREAVDAIGKLPDGSMLSLVNLLTLCRYLDGGKEDGPAQQHIYRPLKMMEDRKIARYEKMTREINALMEKHFTPAELAKYRDERKHFASTGRWLTREEILALALNWGNKGNRDRVTRGFGLDETQVEQILSVLTKKEWDFVQDVWDYLETFWPEIADLEMKVSGVVPEKVEAVPVKLAWGGEYRGGYYPISYDPEKSGRAYINEEERNALYKQFSSAAAHTDHGHTKRRVQTFDRQLKLSFQVLFNHLENVTHDLSYRTAIIDVNRFLMERDTQVAIENAVGVKGYKSIVDALKAVASDQGEYLDMYDKAFRWFRYRATFAIMAYRLSSIPRDIPSNAINTIWEIGPKRFSRAMADFVLNPASTVAFVNSKSERMRRRATMRDRDFMDISRKWAGKDNAFMQFAFITQSLADQAFSYPLWAEVYKQSLDKYGEEKAKNIADEAVTLTMGSGSVLDQAAIQRGSEKKKLLTTFYSWLGAMFNRCWMRGKLAGLEYRKGNVGAAITIMARTALFGWVLQGMSEAFFRELLRNSRGDDDDEKKKIRMLSYFMQQPFSYIPGLNVLAGYGIERAFGGRGDTRIPLQSAAESIINPIADGVKIAFTDKELDRRYFEEAARAGAIIAPYPQQINTWVFNFIDWMHDEGELSWRDILTRRTNR
jgi:hypothetical protein